MRIKKNFLLSYLFVALFAACAKDLPQEAKIFSPVETSRSVSSYSAHAQNGMAATAHPLASAAAVAMLKQDGNAIDAAVAASFVISVVRPQSTGIGGGGFLLLHEKQTQQTLAYDFRERAPAKATANMFLDSQGQPADFHYGGVTIPDASVNGHLAVGTPGLVAGLLHVHKKHGRLPLATVIEPAIRAAEDGFVVYEGLEEAIAERAEIMQHFPATAKIFLPQGKPLKAGDLLVQKDLAWTLKEIRQHGAAAFYEGDVAKKIASEMQRGGGIIALEDLKAYHVKNRRPLTGDYRGYRIVSMPPPSSGGVHIIQMLNMLAGDNYGAYGYNTAPSLHLLAETMRRAFADRAAYLGDPDFVRVPTAGLISPVYAAALRRTIDMTRATPSSELKPGQPSHYESPSTTHLSVMDRFGNAVSSTQTVNYTFGSCVVADGTGIVLNNEMDDFSKKPGAPNVFGLVGSAANAVAPNKTMLSSMSPTLVFNPSGDLRLVVGSPGGPKIINATLQTIINVIDHKMTLANAVHAPRIHHQWLPDELRVEENGLSPDVAAELKRMGHNVVVKGSIGDVQAIEKTSSGLIGVSDTRSEGVPMGY